MKRYLIASLFILFATSSNADEKGECGSGLTYVYEESTKTLNPLLDPHHIFLYKGA